MGIFGIWHRLPPPKSHELCCRKRERFFRPLRLLATPSKSVFFLPRNSTTDWLNSFGSLRGCDAIRRKGEDEEDAAWPAAFPPGTFTSLSLCELGHSHCNLTAGANYARGPAMAGRAPGSEIGHIGQLYHVVNSCCRRRERERVRLGYPSPPGGERSLAP